MNNISSKTARKASQTGKHKRVVKAKPATANPSISPALNGTPNGQPQSQVAIHPNGATNQTPPHPHPAIVFPNGNGHEIDLVHGFDHEDIGNSQRVIAMHGDCLRYCHAMKKWLIWDERRWRVDETDEAALLAMRAMIEFAVQTSRNGNKELAHFAIRSQARHRISNALALAQPRLAILPDALDAHPDLLNFQNGTLNLRTGELSPHAREQYLTKLVHYNYLPEAECPVFLAFLNRIMGYPQHASDADENAAAEMERCARMIDYLQRLFGYALTGHTWEKAAFLLIGKTADNGKTTLLNLFRDLIEEYSTLMQVDTLMVRSQGSNNAQADLADLRGARFVMTSETDEGQRLSEATLKRITQGDGLIKAARKHENPIQFRESAKIFIDCNHPPVIRGTDNGIWNRLHPIPFNVTIPKNEQDRELPKKLRTEAEGILAWAAKGSPISLRDGLKRTKEIQTATDEWRNDSDQVRRFLEECCEQHQAASAQARMLYAAYQYWANQSGEKWTFSERDFSNRLSDLRFTKKKDSVMVWNGIGILTGYQIPACSVCKGNHWGVCRLAGIVRESERQQ